ncbi:hypothetical protein ABZT17_01320 [Streptomyces sp. NPDC005648]
MHEAEEFGDCYPAAMLGALSTVWFGVIDARGGDWATACLVA